MSITLSVTDVVSVVPGDMLVSVVVAPATDRQLVGQPRLVYPSDRTHSPLTEQVLLRLRAIVINGPSKNDHVYFKVGDSQTATPNFMRQFNFGLPHNFGAYTDLESTVLWFDGSHAESGPAAVSTSRSAYGVGKETILQVPIVPPLDPSPLQQSLALTGRLAIIMYGTNQEAYDAYEINMRLIVAQCIAAGVIPIMNTIPRSFPSEPPGNTEFNNIVRRIAEDNLVPLIDVRRETDLLPNSGVEVADGVHLSATATGPFPFGGDLSPEGLLFGANTRNLLTLQALDRVRSGRVLD